MARTFLAGVAAPASCAPDLALGLPPEAQVSLCGQHPDTALLEPGRLFEPTVRLFDAFPSDAPLAKVFYTFARQYMLDYILVKVDRCSLMHSLEVRAPFLDATWPNSPAACPSACETCAEASANTSSKKAVATSCPGDPHPEKNKNAAS